MIIDRKDSFLKQGFFIFIMVLMVWGMLEGMLWVGNKACKGKRFNLLTAGKDVSPYPGDPEHYIKIAIFGESAAAGYGAERGFEQILSYRLKKEYPAKEFYIKNFAVAGVPFHRYEAQLAKRLMDRFDILLIYAGNNEANNYTNDHCFFMPGKKDCAEPPLKTEFDFDIKTWMEGHSRLYATVSRLMNITVLKAPPTSVRAPFAEFEFAKALPDTEEQNIYKNLRDDLEQIAQLAAKKGKQVIISSVATNEFLRPIFSALPAGINEATKDELLSEYYTAMKIVDEGDFIKARAMFFHLEQEAPGVAVFHYMAGLVLYREGQREEAITHFRRAIDTDGIFWRTPDRYHDIFKEVSEKNPAMSFVDSLAVFHEAIKQGYSYDELFNDLQHPSFLGHVLIADSFFRKISVLPVLRNMKENDLIKAAWRDQLSFYRRVLGITAQDYADSKFINCNWFYSISGTIAYRDDYLKTAASCIEQYAGILGNTPEALAVKDVYLSLIELRRGDLPAGLREVNMALTSSKSTTLGLMNDGKTIVASRYFLAPIFARSGIVYSNSQSRFILN